MNDTYDIAHVATATGCFRQVCQAKQLHAWCMACKRALPRRLGLCEDKATNRKIEGSVYQQHLVKATPIGSDFVAFPEPFRSDTMRISTRGGTEPTSIFSTANLPFNMGATPATSTWCANMSEPSMCLGPSVCCSEATSAFIWRSCIVSVQISYAPRPAVLLLAAILSQRSGNCHALA